MVRLVMEDGIPKLVDEIIDANNVKWDKISADSIDIEKSFKPEKQETLEVKRKYRRKSKKYKGVSKTPSGKYQVRYTWKGIRFYFGIYSSKEDAAVAHKYGVRAIETLKDKGLLIGEANSK